MRRGLARTFGLATAASTASSARTQTDQDRLRETAKSLDRRDSDPEPPDAKQARQLVEQEETYGYFPPDSSWPWPGEERKRIAPLRRALEQCGSPERSECHEVAFRLATALLGGVEGHVEDDREPQQRAEGASLMRLLAENGSSDGACGLANGEVVPEDRERAAHFFSLAAQAGCAQSMHELGIMHYLGQCAWASGTAEADDCAEAVRWFRMAAEKGVSGSMFLLAECLLDGLGTQRDPAAALGWWAAAGELGHRSARSRIISRAASGDIPSPPPSAGRPAEPAGDAAAEHRYSAATGRRGDEWRALAPAQPVAGAA